MQRGACSCACKRRTGVVSSPLLRFIEEHGDLFEAEVLDKQLCSHSRAMLARTGRACWTVVVASGLSRAGHRGPGGERLNSLRLSEPQKETKVTNVCCAAARVGHLETLTHITSLHRVCINNKFQITVAAAEGGQLEVLYWLRKNGYPWSAETRIAAWDLGHQYFD